jgi:hypothetical protein
VKQAIQRTGRGPARAQGKAAVPELFDAFEAKQPSEIGESALLGDLRSLVQSARQRIAVAVYSTQTLRCQHIGRRLDSMRLQGARAAYSKQILVTLLRELTSDFGPGFNYLGFARTIQFAEGSLLKQLL